MYKKNARRKLYSERIRQTSTASFHELAEQDKENAAKQINEENLPFPMFFQLMPEIEAMNLYGLLNQRNQTAIRLCAKILKKEVPFEKTLNKSPEEEQIAQEVLSWMLRTGANQDGFSDDYDEVLDSAASLLIHRYKDHSILPILANLIFKRNREGRYIHDLVWVFFEAKDPNAVKHLTNYLHSPNKMDVALAKNLLHFTPVPNNSPGSVLSYIKENDPYIYYTGQSYSQTSEPKPFALDIEAKYLGKELASHRKGLHHLSEEEGACLECFNHIDSETKELLSMYSHFMKKRNLQEWEKWMHSPIEEQINIAKKRLGGRR